MMHSCISIVRRLAVIFALSLFAARAGAADKEYRSAVENYAVPDLVLVNQDGARVQLKNILESDKPVVLDFIYCTGSTISPILSAGYANMQRQLGPGSRNVRLVSVSVDPDNDTPRDMKEYLNGYGAQPGWDFLTGSRSDIDKILSAFKVHLPDKMSLRLLTLIRAPGNGRWTRITGLMSGSEFRKEFSKAGIE